jgi:hypothetical protein
LRRYLIQVGNVSGGEVVKHHNVVLEGDESIDEMRADVPGPTGDQHAHDSY